MDLDFMTLFEKLSPEDRETLIGNLLKSVRGEPTETLLTRKTFKISNQGTDEEIRQRIADVYGVPLNQVPPINIKAESERNRNHWMKVSELTQPYELYLKGLAHTSQDKFEELNDIGRFIVDSTEELELIVPETQLAYPDFTVRQDGRTIGIEHTRLINPKLKAAFNSAKQVITDAEIDLKNRNLDFKCTVNIFINFSRPILNGATFYTRNFNRQEKRRFQ
ncbi:hypothetical protein [Pedobacter sp. P26]|uniref:hypothetical protein n=1 Tax=Pedobacter sp. P26 TaxID=3423956 RepID=UPI003D6715F1